MLSVFSGEKCIAVEKQWFTPPEFERFAGKQSYKNWKLSIRCMDSPLGKLIQVCGEGIFIYEEYLRIYLRIYMDCENKTV